MPTTLKLAHNLEVIVDDEDVELVLQYTWRRVDEANTSYARGCIDHYKSIMLHQLIGGADQDHKNRNGLDNRRCNLRTATKRQQNINREVPQGINGSGYRGVKVSKNKKRYQARIDQQHLGVYDTP